MIISHDLFVPSFTSPEHQLCFDVLMGLEKRKKIPKKHQVQVRELVPEIIQQLNEFLSESSHSPTLKKFYEEVYFRRLAHLDEDTFDRSLISMEVLKFFVPKYYPSYKQYLDNYQKIGSSEITRSHKYYKIALKVIQLGLKLGVAPEPVSKGANGTYFMKDLAGRKLGVFKPSDEEFVASKSKKFRYLANTLPLCDTLIFLHGGNGHKSEYMASIVSRKLKLYIVPTTKVVSLKSFHFWKKSEDTLNNRVNKVGSLQLYIPHAIEAREAFNVYRNWCLLPDRGSYLLNKTKRKEYVLENLSQRDFEHMVITDFLIAQLDRHPGNWYVGEQIFLIDNGATMPHKHSDSRISRLNQYAWKIFPQARVPFDDHANKIIDRLELSLEEIIKRFHRKNLITEEGQEETYRQRVQVLTWYVRLRKTPLQLAAVRSSQDFKKVLKRIQRKVVSTGDIHIV